MQAILLKPVRKLGKIGDIVKVKDGFGRNFLLPQKLAIRATKENLQLFNEKLQDLESRNQETIEKMKEISDKINGKDFLFIKQSADDGRLFGSVSAKEIANIIASNNSDYSDEIKASAVRLDTPIKTVGIHEVTLNLHPEVSAKILINIGRTATEANEALKNYKQNTSETREE